MDKDYVFPPRNLPGVANEWGRTLEDGFKGNAQSVEILGQSLQGLNRSTAASLQDLASQIQELQARTSYSASGTDFSTSTLNSVVTGSATATVNFTLAEDRYVQFTANASFNANGTQPTGANTSALRCGIQANLDGSTLIGDNLSDHTLQFSASAPGRIAFSGGALVIVQTLRVPSGSHSADVTPRSYVTGTSGGASIYDINLTAQILGRA